MTILRLYGGLAIEAAIVLGGALLLAYEAQLYAEVARSILQ